MSVNADDGGARRKLRIIFSRISSFAGRCMEFFSSIIGAFFDEEPLEACPFCGCEKFELDADTGIKNLLSTPFGTGHEMRVMRRTCASCKNSF